MSGAPLAERLAVLPGRFSRDDVLAAFLDYVAQLGLTLYPAQEEALLELAAGKHLILGTPTGSGKTIVALAACLLGRAEDLRVYYTCPIKALVNEKFFLLCEAFGPQLVGLVTGDGTVNRDAPLICCTAEILANAALRGDALGPCLVIMDEFHYYGDPERGAAWQLPLVALDEAWFVLMSATLGDTEAIAARLAADSGRPVARVDGGQRPVPLGFSYREEGVAEAVQTLADAGEAPIYLVNFTQRAAAETAQDLVSLNLLDRDGKRALAEALAGARFDTPYGPELQRLLRAGIGVHHAGLLPRYRLLVEQLSQAGLLKVISGTDSLGVGVNVPIRTVLFRQLCKYDGVKTSLLSARQFHQIAGRAGRRGFDDHGLVVALAPEHVVENRRIELKLLKEPHLRRKLVKKRPPERGYVHWDQAVFERLRASPPEPLGPVLEVSHGMLVQVLRAQATTERRPAASANGRLAADNGYRRLVGLLRRSHLAPGQQRYQLRRAAQLTRALLQAELVAVTPPLPGGSAHGSGPGVVASAGASLPADPLAPGSAGAGQAGRGGRRLLVRPGLQDDFSLNQTLSLFLVEALDLLEAQPAPGEELRAALDMLSLVEAIIENPTVVLLRQVDRLKGELVARLKAEGVPYEERLERLEQVEHPKPLAELLYDAFDRFRRHHPWARSDDVRPKSIARELYERGLGFNEYVSEYGLQRSEGVLLRYLSQAYKTASQNVPSERRSEAYEDVLAFLQTLVRLVDASLLEEWERLLTDTEGGPAPAAADNARRAAERPGAPALPERPRVQVDLAADERALARRVRSELHLLVRSLADRDYAQAGLRLRQTETRAWSAQQLADALQPYWDEHATLVTTPAARRPELTSITPAGQRRWTVTQRLLDPADHGDWALFCVVDLTGPVDPDGPLVELERIGV